MIAAGQGWRGGAEDILYCSR